MIDISNKGIYNIKYRKVVYDLSFNFNPLWKLLIDKDMTRTNLAEAIGVSRSTLAKMGKNEYVAMEVLDRICNYLNCGLSDIVEHVKDEMSK